MKKKCVVFQTAKNFHSSQEVAVVFAKLEGMNPKHIIKHVVRYEEKLGTNRPGVSGKTDLRIFGTDRPL